MNQIQAMRVFTRVVDLTSFGLAAKQLGMSPAAVTRSISTLEAHLNVRLLNRSTRRLSLTCAGESYLSGCRTIIDQLDSIEADLVRSTRDLSGTIRIAASSAFAAVGLSALLAAYRAANPRIQFDVTSCDNTVELVEGGYDVGFSVQKSMRNCSMVSRPLTTYKELALASPAYLAKRGTPASPAELNTHNLLSKSDGSTSVWEFNDDNGVYRVTTGNALSASSIVAVRAAALADMGVALLPAPMVKDDLAAGRLLPILGQYQIGGGVLEVSVIYPSRQYLSPRVRRFIDFTVAQYRSPEAESGVEPGAEPVTQVLA